MIATGLPSLPLMVACHVHFIRQRIFPAAPALVAHDILVEELWSTKAALPARVTAFAPFSTETRYSALATISPREHSLKMSTCYHSRPFVRFVCCLVCLPLVCRRTTVYPPSGFCSVFPPSLIPNLVLLFVAYLRHNWRLFTASRAPRYAISLRPSPTLVH